MVDIRERYTATPVGVNTAVSIKGSSIGGFLCTVAGTVTLVRNDVGGGTTTLVNAMAITVGAYYPMPWYLSDLGGTITTAGGGAGVLGA